MLCFSVFAILASAPFQPRHSDIPMMITSVVSPAIQFELPDGLIVAASTDPQGPLLAEFFEFYDRAFILSSEKEEWSGFVDCLSLNHGNSYARLASIWGPFREWVLLVRDRVAADPVIGGANLICFPIAADGESVVLAMNLNYLFVESRHRRRGYLRKILGACQELVRRSFQPLPMNESAPLLTFIEQNDPLKLNAEEYARDSFHAGIDQVDRVRIWQRAGAKIINFPYVQPALSDDQFADTGLMLSVVGVEGDVLDACLLKLHLERFFGISVLKGRDPRFEATSREQLTLCEDACLADKPFALLDPHRWLESLGGGPPYELRQEFNALGLPNRLSEFYAANTLNHS